jgi:hypothetical protein
VRTELNLLFPPMTLTGRMYRKIPCMFSRSPKKYAALLGNFLNFNLHFYESERKTFSFSIKEGIEEIERKVAKQDSHITSII